MKILIDKRMNYIFYKKEEDYFLEIICGTIAIYEKKICLNSEQVQEYNKLGESYIDQLVNVLRQSK